MKKKSGAGAGAGAEKKFAGSPALLSATVYKKVISKIKTYAKKCNYFLLSIEFGKNLISEISRRLMIGQNYSLDFLLLAN